MADRLAEISPATVHKQVSEFLATRLKVLRYVRDALADSQYKQKKNMMLKVEVVLNIIRSEIKLYPMLKTTTNKRVVRRLHDKVASARYWTIYGRLQEGTCVHAQRFAQTAHISCVLRPLA